MSFRSKRQEGIRISIATTKRFSGICLFIFALLVLWESRKLPMGTLQSPGPAFMPVLLASVLIAIALLMLVFGGNSSPLRSLQWSEAGHAAFVLAACGFTALALERLGYRITMGMVLAFLLGAIERNKPVVVVSLAVGFSLLSYWLFGRLGVLLPKGPMGF
jgi:hypothetical protein